MSLCGRLCPKSLEFYCWWDRSLQAWYDCPRCQRCSKAIFETHFQWRWEPQSHEEYVQERLDLWSQSLCSLPWKLFCRVSKPKKVREIKTSSEFIDTNLLTNGQKTPFIYTDTYSRYFLFNRVPIWKDKQNVYLFCPPFNSCIQPKSNCVATPHLTNHKPRNWLWLFIYFFLPCSCSSHKCIFPENFLDILDGQARLHHNKWCVSQTNKEK